MNEQEQLVQRFICLKQLRLTKYQLIWNREFELLMLETVDKPTIDRAELTNEVDPEILNKIKGEFANKVHMKATDIGYAEKEIGLLNKIIDELELQTDM